MIGQQVGNYKITDLLGEGGMGVVYRAEHAMVGRPVALKVLLPEWSKNEGIVKRFFNEARATAKIHHRGIPEIYDCGVQTDGRAWIAMQLLEGETLGQMLARVGKLPPDEAIDVAKQTAEVLGAAHAADIVHRDLKPDNIFICRDPAMPFGRKVVLLDFGIAKLAQEDGGGNTRTGIIMGTPDYMAPEQCMGAKRADARADIYALGCILFHMLAGRVPFQGSGPGAIMAAHLGMPAPPVGKEAQVSPNIDALVQKMMAKEPEQRPATTAEVVGALGGTVQIVRQMPVMPSMTPPGMMAAPAPVHAPVPAAAPADYLASAPDASTFRPPVGAGARGAPPPPVQRTEILSDHGQPQKKDDDEPPPHAGLAAARDKARKSIGPAIVVTLILVAAITMVVVGYIVYGS